MLISFSGFDGAGKTTQIQLLLKHYEQAGLKTASIYDLIPTIRYHSYQDLIEYYQYLSKFDAVHLRFRLNSDENSKIMNELEFSDFTNPYLAEAAALQGFYDYYQLNKYVTEPLLSSGKIVISDRHYYDEIAFKSIYGCSYSRMLKMYNEIRVPDLAFYLEVSADTVFKRNQLRSDGQTTLYKNIHFIEELGSFFEKVIHDTNLMRIDGRRSISDIQSTIQKYVKNR